MIDAFKAVFWSFFGIRRLLYVIRTDSKLILQIKAIAECSLLLRKLLQYS